LATSFQAGEGGRHPAQFGTFAKQAQVYGAYVWAYLVLAAALVVLLRSPHPPRPCRKTAFPPRKLPDGRTPCSAAQVGKAAAFA
jgi:hypothetical protein